MVETYFTSRFCSRRASLEFGEGISETSYEIMGSSWFCLEVEKVHVSGVCVNVVGVNSGMEMSLGSWGRWEGKREEREGPSVRREWRGGR